MLTPTPLNRGEIINQQNPYSVVREFTGNDPYLMKSFPLILVYLEKSLKVYKINVII